LHHFLEDSVDYYDGIERYYHCECMNCDTQFKAVQMADLSWWVASDGKGAYMEEVSR
jgi:hypothetical protein